jgi:hypothetical protein
MFDTDRPGSVFASTLPPADAAASPDGPAVVPLERLEAQICELAGHLAAATCRFLVLLADLAGPPAGPPAGVSAETPADMEAPAAETLLPASPALPEPEGGIDAAHDAEITGDTIIPPWHGERLDLDHAIYVCFANARTHEEKRADQEQAQEAVFRPKSWGGDFSTTVEYIRRYYDEHPAA